MPAANTVRIADAAGGEAAGVARPGESEATAGALLVATVADAAANSVALGYDGDGNIATVTTTWPGSTKKKVTTLTWDVAGNLLATSTAFVAV